MRTKPKYYKLENKIAVPCELDEWARCLELKTKIVQQTQIGAVEVSTVFLGLDHSYGEGEPLLFETMVFGGDHDEEMWRCSTWVEAVEQHRKVLCIVQNKPVARS